MRRRSRGRGARAPAPGPLNITSDTTHDGVWYAGYGSNTLPERLLTYLAGDGPGGRFGEHPSFAGDREVSRTAWTTTRHRLYFAGRSVRWEGAVAFLGLRAEAGVRTRVRLHLLTAAQLAHVATVENNVPDLTWGGRVEGLAVGGSRRLDLPRGLDPRRAKYDTVLRLPDHEGRPVVTLTTGRDLEPGRPGAAYRAVLAAGLADSDLAEVPGAVEGYLDAAVAGSFADGPGRLGVSSASNTCSD